MLKQYEWERIESFIADNDFPDQFEWEVKPAELGGKLYNWLLWNQLNALWTAFCICCYTVEGRQGLHDNLRVNVGLMLQLMRQPLYGRSAEYADNRISLFSAQWGKCAVTGREFQVTGDIHCHHKRPKAKGGSDEYGNLVLVLTPVHRLIHATDEGTIGLYLRLLNLDKGQLSKLNELREQAGLQRIA